MEREVQCLLCRGKKGTHGQVRLVQIPKAFFKLAFLLNLACLTYPVYSSQILYGDSVVF